MTDNLIYRLTLQGRTESDEAAGAFGGDAKKLLETVGDGASFQTLSQAIPELPEASLRDVIDQLVAHGSLETEYGDLTSSDLDITRCFSLPVTPPSVRQKQEAERQTLSGMRALKQAGYFVNIVNRVGQPVPPRHGQKHVVLIIDGDENNTMLVARELLMAGFDTRSAAACDEIIAALNRQPPVDVIAMEAVLPDVIGLELLGRLRQHPVYKTVPIIVMAAKVGHDDVLAALAYGASGYLSKPFKPESMLESVRAVLGLH